MEKRPDEVWVIKINPIRRKEIPKTGADIIDRRNELAGNLSLLKQIHFIECINMMIEKRALNEELLKKYKPNNKRWIAMKVLIVFATIFGVFLAGASQKEYAYRKTGVQKRGGSY